MNNFAFNLNNFVIVKQKELFMNDITLYEKIPEIENSFPIKIKRYFSKNIQPHWHEHLELLYIISGKGEFCCGSKKFFALSGETVVVNGSELHLMQAEQNLDYICLIINPSFFKNINFENIFLKSKIPCDDFIKSRFEKIFNEQVQRTPHFDMRIMGETYALLAHLASNYTRAEVSSSEYERILSGLKKTNSILDYIHENYAEEISTATIAKKFFLSESYLCHIFKQATGKTVIKYLNGFRAQKASVLLEKTDENILLVAAKCGFENVSYFNRVFKEHFSLTPTEYRNKKR